MRRLASLAALAALAMSCGTGGTSATPAPRPTPDYGVQMWSGEPDGSNNCGDFAVGWSSPELGGGGPKATLHAVEGGNVVLDLVGRDDVEQLSALWCGNIAADGRFELATQRFTGGAHCCYTIRVDTLDGPTLLEHDLGNQGGLDPKQLDGEGADELIGSSDVLAYFGDLPYAATQALPLVFAFRGGRYVEATSDFPDHVRSRLADAAEDLATALEDGFEDAVKGMAIGVYGYHVLLGGEDDALAELKQRVPDEIDEWLDEHADEAAKLVRGEATPAPKDGT